LPGTFYYRLLPAPAMRHAPGQATLQEAIRNPSGARAA